MPPRNKTNLATTTTTADSELESLVQAVEATSTNAQPAAYRIEPAEDGSEIDPPHGGSWIRDADGGLVPADQSTAEGAGLAWPQQ